MSFHCGKAKLYSHAAKSLMKGSQWNEWEQVTLDPFSAAFRQILQETSWNLLNFPREINKKKETFSWWIKLHIFYVKVSWEFHLGMRDCHPSCWGDAVCSPLGQPEPLPSSLEIPRKKTRLVLTSSRGGFCSALLHCCKPVFWVRSSWARGESNGVLAEELLNTDRPFCN